MASEKIQTDEDPLPDPFEAELVAYLDGELDEAAARQVEARLARDPAARARAAELKKSFDLLDYLPRSEPSATFTTRTLDKLPAIKPTGTPSSTRGPQSPFPVNTRAASSHGSGALSSSVPVPLELDDLPPSRSNRSRTVLWFTGIFAGMMAFATIGYLASAVARPYLFSQQEFEETKTPDPRVIERLPLYAVADDIAFVTKLAQPEFFGDDPAVAFDLTLRIPNSDVSNKPTGKQFEELEKKFRTLPTDRKVEIVKLDQELQEKEPKERDRLFRVLETYAVWLDRLPESDRHGILQAATPALRLGAIRAVLDQQWANALPASVRAKPELVRKWKEEQVTRREQWAYIRQHAETLATNKAPWPFDTEAGRKGVVDFARTVFKVDDVKKCRLSPVDLTEYRRTLAEARREETWAWYGLLVYELNKQHPYLPESDNSKLMITEPNELPEPYFTRVTGKKGGTWRAKTGLIGKWPEFPLEIHDLRLAKISVNNLPPLGPARLNDFKKPVRDFAHKELFLKMTSAEKHELERLQGKWPEYPREFLKYAHKYDLSVPGVMLPGSPKKWDAIYDLHSGNRSHK